MSNRVMRSTFGAIGFVVCITFGFIWTTYNPNAPYSIFTEGLTVGFIAFLGKRLAQKSKLFGGETTSENGDANPLMMSDKRD
jgi:hypothetical protein